MAIDLEALRSRTDGAVLAERLDQIARCKEVKREIMLGARKACQPHDEKIARIRKQIMDDDLGISKAALDHLLEEQDLRRRLEALKDRLDEDDARVVAVLREEMGDFGETPLGRHAGGLRLVANAG